MYKPKNYSYLIGLPGLSDALLKNHFSLYEGYVKNTNKLAEILAMLLKEKKTDTPEYAELKRRFGWEFNGMRLHEYYFENIAKDGNELDKGKHTDLFKKMEEDFGSGENCANDFKATGLSRGIGWVVLYYDPIGKRLFNAWINEHDLGHLAGAVPLLVMDVFEHAYMLDYGLKRADYIEIFLEAIDWQIVANRFEKAIK